MSKAEQIATFGRAGWILAREIQTMPDWAEQLYAVAKTGDIVATAQWLRAKVRDFCNHLEDLIALEAERGCEPEAQAPNWQ